jgi:hypothetical protein
MSHHHTSQTHVTSSYITNTCTWDRRDKIKPEGASQVLANYKTKLVDVHALFVHACHERCQDLFFFLYIETVIQNSLMYTPSGTRLSRTLPRPVIFFWYIETSVHIFWYTPVTNECSWEGTTWRTCVYACVWTRCVLVVKLILSSGNSTNY